MKKYFTPVVLAIIAGFLLLFGMLIVSTKIFHYRVPGFIRAYFEKYLIAGDTLPSEKADALYILGGSARSTSRHIKKTASLFHSGKTERILLFDTKAKWHYESELERNITKNELSIKILVMRGVPKSSIDTIPVKEGFFGTLSEARALDAYLRKKSFKTVILVSSPCHSRRVTYSFEHYLKKSGITMYVASSEDTFSFSELILETVKVFVYKMVLLSDWVTE